MSIVVYKDIEEALSAGNQALAILTDDCITCCGIEPSPAEHSGDDQVREKDVREGAIRIPDTEKGVAITRVTRPEKDFTNTRERWTFVFAERPLPEVGLLKDSDGFQVLE